MTYGMPLFLGIWTLMLRWFRYCIKGRAAESHLNKIVWKQFYWYKKYEVNIPNIHQDIQH